jgi:hypothetical protein
LAADYLVRRDTPGCRATIGILVALTISIAYDLPRSPWWRLIGRFLGGPYSRWCLRQIAGQASA